MNEQYTLEELVKLADTIGNLNDISNLIVQLYDLNNDRGLELILNLAMSDFGGITYKAEFQNISIIGSLYWGIKGVRKLGQKAIANGGYRAMNNVTLLLSYISSKSLNNFPYSNYNLENVKRLELTSDKYKTEEWIIAAKETLVEVVKSVEKEDAFPIGIVQNLSFPINKLAQEHIFAALIARWFNINLHGLTNYIELVNSIGKPEIDYQNFLKSNPYILEPFHAQIWSKPRFGEDLVPDFLIQSMDNSYTVVEIEQPDFKIITSAGELSAKTTHAKRQAMDFRDWAINNNLYATQRFKEIYRPFCLIVIGRESDLNKMQIKRLKQENESTQGVLKIVGFDWLFNRAKSTFDNLIKFGFDRDTFKETIDEKNAKS
ncbi:MAG: DUF4263 domain-containing protein [Bacteroidales bacterium]|nr:DUF4263 domain-containing protein [Bacteroidales bacterium]